MSIAEACESKIEGRDTSCAGVAVFVGRESDEDSFVDLEGARGFSWVALRLANRWLSKCGLDVGKTWAGWVIYTRDST